MIRPKTALGLANPERHLVIIYAYWAFKLKLVLLGVQTLT